MRGNVAYLDSGAIAKRYVKEKGSEHVRLLYLAAYAGEIKLSFSIWNVGEVLGVLDKARRRGLLSGDEYSTAKRRFLMETRRMVNLGILLVVPLSKRIIVESWKLIEKHHIYQADAIQVISAKRVACREFVTADGELHRVALTEGLKSTYLG
jgi:predicted nucleic acid-binding protein